jgi:hypothetical protein
MNPIHNYLRLRKLAIFAMACFALGSAWGEALTLADTTDGRYLIRGSFEVQARQSQVWDVLTDYAGLGGIVSTLAKSEILQRQDGEVLVRQLARGRFLFFHRDIPLLLRIDEKPLNSLSFTEISKNTFKNYDGSWTLHDLSGTVKVDYMLQVSRAALAPAFIERGLFKDNALSLLKEMKAEISRRVELRAQGCGVSTSAVATAPQVAALKKTAE